jgi:hypothetical protein
MANTPPKEFIRVMPERLRSFVAEAFQNVGTSAEDAALLAELLVVTDLRGVFSHGTRQVPGYIHDDHWWQSKSAAQSRSGKRLRIDCGYRWGRTCAAGH